MSEAKKRVNRDMVLDMLEANRFLTMMLERDKGDYNSIVVTKDGIEYSKREPGISVKPTYNDKGELVLAPVKKLVVTFEQINDHLELEG